ncbi:hypothetical protein MKD33_21685, partial [Chromobacterium piscinae]
FPYCAD